jgi:hypothetical protein
LFVPVVLEDGRLFAGLLHLDEYGAAVAHDHKVGDAVHIRLVEAEDEPPRHREAIRDFSLDDGL